MMLELVDSLDQVTSNCATMASYLTSPQLSDAQYARDRIAGVACFLAIEVAGQISFFPSRFIGYKNNSLAQHETGDNKDGRKTNRAISDLIKEIKLEKSESLESRFLNFCKLNEIAPFRKSRAYWNVTTLEPKLNPKVPIDIDLEGLAFQKEITVFRRSSSLVARVKANRKPICECCAFNFEKAYGEFAKGYIECHHLDPLSKRAGKNVPTTEDEIALLCANCHRMVHRTREGLTLDELRAEMKKAKQPNSHEKARR